MKTDVTFFECQVLSLTFSRKVPFRPIDDMTRDVGDKYNWVVVSHY